MWTSTWKDEQHYSLFIGLLFGLFCFGEGDGVGRVIESGGVPSDSGKRGFFLDNAFFLKVGQETLDDLRVGAVRSRLWEATVGKVEGPALAFFVDGIQSIWFDDVGDVMNEILHGLWLSAVWENGLTRNPGKMYYIPHVPARLPGVLVFFIRHLFWLGSATADLRFLLELGDWRSSMNYVWMESNGLVLARIYLTTKAMSAYIDCQWLQELTFTMMALAMAEMPAEIATYEGRALKKRIQQQGDITLTDNYIQVTPSYYFNTEANIKIDGTSNTTSYGSALLSSSTSNGPNSIFESWPSASLNSACSRSLTSWITWLYFEPCRQPGLYFFWQPKSGYIRQSDFSLMDL
jgi:hypothetical protein